MIFHEKWVQFHNMNFTIKWIVLPIRLNLTDWIFFSMKDEVKKKISAQNEKSKSTFFWLEIFNFFGLIQKKSNQFYITD